MKSLIMDSGPLISLATNNLLWILEPLKKQFNGHFFITNDTKRELVDTPLDIKRFEFEALQIYYYIKEGVIEILFNEEIKIASEKMLDTANHIFMAHGHWITIMQRAEIETLAGCIYAEGNGVIIDERTCRDLIENPLKLKSLLQHKLHTRVEINKGNLNEFSKMSKKIKVIRSSELVMVAYWLGLLDKYLADNKAEAKRKLVDGVLWALKLHGCAISRREIDVITKGIYKHRI